MDLTNIRAVLGNRTLTLFNGVIKKWKLKILKLKDNLLLLIKR